MNILITFYMFIPQKVIKRTFIDKTFGPNSLIDLIMFEYHFLICFMLIVFTMVGLVINLTLYGHFKYQVKAWGKSILLSVILGFAGCCTVYIIYQG